MPKKKIQKILLDQKDFKRALLSDTTPAELPLPVGNDGFYLNVRDWKNFDAFSQKLIETFVLPPKYGKQATNPLSYKIVKDSDSLRKLGLPHPRAQLDVCNFYSRYFSLLAYYCGKSSFSIRRPVCTASKYYISGPMEASNELKFSTISTVDKDKFTKHPASFFAYSGYERLHKFFGSTLFDSLERKFRFMSSQDVSKCFHSLYTHSISWATKSVKEAKDNTSAEMYGASFDRLMQSMNRNETNGIIVGPEVSRIFAETILSDVDVELERRLDERGLTNGSDYAAFRYVDNYYFFCRSQKDCDQIHADLADCLDEYKLHLNPAKGEVTSRPFANKKSSAIQKSNTLINELIDNLTDTVRITDSSDSQPKAIDIVTAKKIRSRRKLMSALVQRVRVICVDSGLGYEGVSGYLLAAIKWRTRQLTKDSEHLLALPDEFSLPSGNVLRRQECLLRASDLLDFYLEFAFHLFSLSPTVNASLDISFILVQVAEFLKKNTPDEFLATKEKVQLWVSRLVSSSSLADLVERQYSTSIEVLNVICATKPFDFGGAYYVELLEELKGTSAKVGYFEVVAKLFVFGGDPECKAKQLELLASAEAFILKDANLSTCSERLHLFLDLMGCPFIEADYRRKLVRRLLEGYNLQQRSEGAGGSIKIPTNAHIAAAISNFEQNPWFTTWDSINLLRLIEKKELKRAYA
ncbi:antiviral reverse transcriptase Drt3b [Ruegeria sp. Ofav3-42]|uniref:antiviral reverse transcriptase Drt3b n=1 Tax=Ruegeria sp. Ofav3-42 TaxID=2917759 RepID=UPI001EF72B2F|nr:antiviral reverse transcriptase Drt3b [Ruegeria sp. Ofav3-42]MCG7520554.1 RNA-directed DNA polymerase [Ruegeria sp. Ofav3-42]